MTQLADYQDKFRTIRFRREDGILEMTLHTDGGSLRLAITEHLRRQINDLLPYGLALEGLAITQ